MKRASLYIGLGLLLGLPAAAMADDKIAVDELEIIAPETTDDMPMGQAKSGEEVLLPQEGELVDQGIFGIEGGYIHPYLQVEETYSDNIFATSTDETSSWITKFSPGIWLSLPRKTEIPITLAANNTSAGGLMHQVADNESGDKVQLYALAGADVYMYSDDSDYNFEDYYLEGMARYNMASGLSLQILNRFNQGHSIFQTVGSGSEDNIREYDNNLLMLTADWDVTEKVRFRLDYSLFDLTYDDVDNDFLERQDDVIDLYAYYKYSIKTSFFVQYRYADIEYDSATENDNDQNAYYAGIRYNTTDKLALLYKIGVQDKQFDNEIPGYDDSDNLSMDLQAIYQMSEKVQLTLDLYRNNEESDSQEASDREVLGVNLGYNHEISEKITARLDVGYSNSDYSQLPGAPSREDDNYFIRPAVQYLFRDWLMAEAGYAFEKTDSSDDEFDFETNLFSVSLNFAL